MAAEYFDVTDDADLALLEAGLKGMGTKELGWFIDGIEFEILNQYKKGDAADVYLAGFNHTDSTQTDADLADALRRTIAKVANHRYRYQHHKEGVLSESHGRRTTVFASPSNPSWPKSYRDFLVRFDLRQVGW